MRISKDKIAQVAVDFMQEQVMPKASGITAFTIGFAMPYIKRNATAMIDQYSSVMTALGIMDHEHKINIEDAYNSAMSAIDHMNGKLNIMGYIADKSDIERVREICMRYSE